MKYVKLFEAKLDESELPKMRPEVLEYIDSLKIPNAKIDTISGFFNPRSPTDQVHHAFVHNREVFRNYNDKYRNDFIKHPALIIYILRSNSSYTMLASDNHYYDSDDAYEFEFFFSNILKVIDKLESMNLTVQYSINTYDKFRVNLFIY